MLTKRQGQILDIIRQWINDNGYSPTLEEIGVAAGISAKSTVHQHISTLIKVGLLKQGVGKRAYQLPDEADLHHSGSIPLAGKISAGLPIQAIFQDNQINPSELFSGNERYVLLVEGESMIDVGIFDGDYVVVERCDTVRDGEIAVALVADEEATLKRIYRRGHMVELMPENSSMSTMLYPANQVRIQGRLVGLFRKY